MSASQRTKGAAARDLASAQTALVDARVGALRLLAEEIPKCVDVLVRIVEDPATSTHTRMQTVLGILERTPAGLQALRCLAQRPGQDASAREGARMLLDPRNQAWALRVLEGQEN